MDSFRRRLMVALAAAPDIPYVDLGLPSGTLWSAYSIGASSPEGEGLYFSWGNTDGHTASDGYVFNKNNYNNTLGAKLTASFNSGDATYDAARANWGGAWRIPTYNDYVEIRNNTDQEWTSINGVYGVKAMKKSDHSIYVFFPSFGNRSQYNTQANPTLGFFMTTWYRNTDDYFSFQTSQSELISYPGAHTFTRFGGAHIRPCCTL